MVAISVGLADQLKPEIRKALLHAGDQGVDAVMAVAAHQGVDVSGVAGPVRGQHLAPAAWRSFVPQLDIAAGNGVDVGHFSFSFDGAGQDRPIDYRRFARPDRLPRGSWICGLNICFLGPHTGSMAQRSKSATFSSGHAPSQGIVPARSRS